MLCSSKISRTVSDELVESLRESSSDQSMLSYEYFDSKPGDDD